MAKFFVFFLTLYLTTMAGAAVCFAISATVRVFAVANLLSAFIFIVMMVYTMLVVLLWTPAQRKRASMLYFANVFF